MSNSKLAIFTIQVHIRYNDLSEVEPIEQEVIRAACSLVKEGRSVMAFAPGIFFYGNEDLTHKSKCIEVTSGNPPAWLED